MKLRADPKRGAEKAALGTDHIKKDDQKDRSGDHKKAEPNVS
jgi:hypothetical protein